MDIYEPTKVLDHGFVRLVDHMGSDFAIVNAARVSYQIYGETKSDEDNETLIRYLMRHKHTSPFEMCELKFHCKMPIFIARQWIRHRTASVNEVSGRYSELPAEFYLPEERHITKQSDVNKQGGTNSIIREAKEARWTMDIEQIDAGKRYGAYLESGMRKELARINLPLSTYTEWYWKIDLHNLFHFLQLRLDSHAQYEIREYAEAIGNITKYLFPMSYRAFEDYRLNAMTLSSREVGALKQFIKEKECTPFINKREREEFEAKIKKLGL